MKHCEHALVYRVTREMKQRGHNELRALPVKTDLNMPLIKVLDDVGFMASKETGGGVEYVPRDIDSFRDELIYHVPRRLNPFPPMSRVCSNATPF